VALTPSRRREAQIESWLGRRWAEMQNIDSQRNTVAAQLGKMEQELADSSVKAAGGLGMAGH